MAHVVLFHSVYGRSPAVLAAADRLRTAGHTVIAPDLYAGQLAATVDEGFALCDRIGWPVIVGRARQALDGLPAETALAGLSMGASVAAALLGERPRVAGVLLLHNTVAAMLRMCGRDCRCSCTSPTRMCISPRRRSSPGSRT